MALPRWAAICTKPSVRFSKRGGRLRHRLVFVASSLGSLRSMPPDIARRSISTEGGGRYFAEADAAVATGRRWLRWGRLNHGRGALHAYGLNCAERHNHSDPVACSRREPLGSLRAQPRVRGDE